MKLTRRTLLELAALSAGGVALSSLAHPRVASAAPDDGQLLLVCYFSGGWDQLLAFDPRPTNGKDYQLAAATAAGGSGIFPGYELVKDKRVTDIVASTGGSGVQKSGALTFGPAVSPEFVKHAADFSIGRGLFMGTLTHDVGRRYLITGKFPRGLTASGSSIGTVVATADGKDALVPNLAVNMEAYNSGLPAYASPIGIQTAADLLNILRPLGAELDAKSDAALLSFEKGAPSCRADELDGSGMAALYRGSREKARTMVAGPEAQLFNFKFPAPSAEIQAVYDAFNLKTSADLATGRGRAAIAALALSHGVSQAASVEVANDLDDHFDWADTHATNLYNGFDAIGALVQYLKDTEYKTSGASTWSRTTMLVFSEFARTPLLNGRDGRDHHLASSCLVAGPGLKKGVVIGGTSNKGMDALPLDLASGKPDDAGVNLRPQDVHATLLKSMGISYDQLSNQSPREIGSLLV
jgi:hypothetical protein